MSNQVSMCIFGQRQGSLAYYQLAAQIDDISEIEVNASSD